MEWIKELLKGNVEEDKLESVVDAFKKEAPKHMIPKSEFNNKNDELKETKAKMDELKSQVEELSKADEVTEKLKQKLEEAKNNFETFKEETEKREQVRIKKQALINNFRNANVTKDAVDLLVNEVNVEEIQLDKKGNIVDFDDILQPIKEKRSSLFIEKQVQGNEPDKGNSDQTDYSKMSDAEYYAAKRAEKQN